MLTKANKWRVASGFAGLGGVVGLGLWTYDGGLAQVSEIGSGMAIYLVFACLTGALLAGYMLANLMGQDGAPGWAAATLGALGATGFGAIIGGTLVVPVYGSIAAPFLVFGIMQRAPVLALIWAIGAILLHLWAARLRAAQSA